MNGNPDASTLNYASAVEKTPETTRCLQNGNLYFVVLIQ